MEHIRASVADLQGIQFNLINIEVLDSSHDGGSYVALIPTTGFDEILELHDRLYTGILESSWREDLPFQPQITVGRFNEGADATHLVEQLGEKNIQMAGTITELTVVSLADSKLTTVESIPLKNLDQSR